MAKTNIKSIPGKTGDKIADETVYKIINCWQNG